MGIMAHASTVAWNITGVKGIDGAALNAGSVYVFFVETASGKADVTSWAGLDGKGAAALETALSGANYNYTATGANGTFSKPAMALDTAGVSAATKYSVYAVILDTTTFTDESHYFVTAATAASTTYNADSALTKTYTLTASASATASNWYAAAPEPTSGLLMLLGLAGLALKRKRA